MFQEKQKMSNWVNKLIIPIIVVVVVAAGIGAYFVFQKPAFPEPQIGRCGDGVCDNPLYVYLEFHLDAQDFPDKEELNKFSNTLLAIADVLEKHNAKASFLVRPQHVEAALKYNDKTLMELEKRGHDIGVHTHLYPGFTDTVADTISKLNQLGVKQVISANPGFRLAQTMSNEAINTMVSKFKNATDEMIAGGIKIYAGAGSGIDSAPYSPFRPAEGYFYPNPATGDKSRTPKEDPNGPLVSVRGVPSGSYVWKEGGESEVFYESEMVEKIQPKLETALKETSAKYKDKFNFFPIAIHEFDFMDVERDPSNPAVPLETNYNENHPGFKALDKFLTEVIDPFIKEGKIKWVTIAELYKEYVRFIERLTQTGKCGDGTCDELEKANPNLCPGDCEEITAQTLAPTSATSASDTAPYYFIAIHHEPCHVPGGEKMLAKEYNTLKRMLAKADQYNIKLTLMFTPQWADYISASSERMAELESWKKKGHEIAGHHHSIYHGNWDGYTDYSKEEAENQRIEQGFKPEKYLGTLSDFINKLKKLNPNIKSCCCNEEHDKKEMPDEMIYATCSGFANCGEVGTRLGDTDKEKGNNEYILTGTANGILRKWLTHFQITNPERQKSAQTAFDSLNSSYVFGAVTHAASGTQEEEYYKFLEFLHSKDPEGKQSRTVNQIIEQKLLSEKTISTDLLNQKTEPIAKPRQSPGQTGKCGDGVCDDLEKANPNLCPGDCD